MVNDGSKDRTGDICNDLAKELSDVADVICRVSRNSSGEPILFLPSTGGGLPKGVLEIEVNGLPMEATVAKIAVNVVRNPETLANELPNILRAWFGDQVGLPGRSNRCNSEGATPQ